MRCRSRPALRAAIVLAAVAVFAPRPARGDDPVPGPESAEIDPVPIRRIVLPPDRIHIELEKARKGEWVVLSRAEFEEKLRQARGAGPQAPPRLIEARYQASLIAGALVGTAEWHAVNPTTRPALLPLPSFNLAVRKALVRKGVSDTAEALLGELGGRGLGWLVEAAGENVATLDWSARGVPVPEGLRLDLRLPAAAVATLDLILPAERTVDPSEQYLLSGPFPTEHPERRRWRLDCGGRSQLDLMIRRTEPAGRPPLILAQCEVRQELEPDLVRAEYDFQVEVLHQPLRELDFHCDPELRPLEVGGRNVASWEVRAAEAAGQPCHLIVRFRDGYREGAVPVRIRALAPVNLHARWTAPNVRLPGAVLRAKTVGLRIHPELHLEEWTNGSYQFAAPTAAAAGRGRDPWQVISLVSGGADADVAPSARIVLTGPEYRCRQTIWWRVGPEVSSLVTEITYEVVQGELFRLFCGLPDGWEADRVELASGGALRSWAVVRTATGPVIHAELQHPLTAGASPARLAVRLQARSSVSSTTAGHRVSFPVIIPLGARASEGAYGIDLDARLEATPVTLAAAAAPDERGPWLLRPPQFAYRFRGVPPTGVLQVRQRQERRRARVASEVIVGAERCAVQTRFVIHQTDQSRPQIDLLLPEAGTSQWSWRVEAGATQIHSVQRLRGVEAATHLVGIGATPLGFALSTAMPCRPEFWRITLTEPVQGPVILQGTVSLTAGDSAERASPAGARVLWDVPLPVVVGEMARDGEVSIRTTNLDDVRAEARGLTEARTATTDAGPPTWKTLRYGDELPWLRLIGRPGTPAQGPGVNVPSVEDASVTATWFPDRVRYRYRCRVCGWPQAVLPMRLPAEARLLTARAGARWILSLTSAAQPDGRAVFQLPLPQADDPQTLELVYEAPLPGWGVTARLPRVEPELAVVASSVRYVWRLPAAMVPLRQERWERVADDPGGEDVGVATAGWQWPAGEMTGGSMIVVRYDAVTAAGMILAGLGTLLLWCGPTVAGGARRVVFVVGLAYGGLGTVWLPQTMQPLAWYPLLAALAALAASVVRFAFAGASNVAPLLKAAAIAAPLVLLTAAGRAEAPAPFTVYLLAPQGDPARFQSALAGPDLVERLDDLASRQASVLAATAIVSAEYTGEVLAERAVIRARLRVRARAPSETTVAVPLGGVQLQSARCNGAEVAAAALRAPREGFSLAVPGPGQHELELEFVVPLAGTGEERELRFAIPEISQSRLQLRLPAGTRAPYVGAARGAVRLPPPRGSGPDLRADLGAVPTVLVRWRQDALQPRPPVFQVREAYLWDLHPAFADLHAVLQYAITQGVVSSFVVQLPDGLDVRRADVARLPGPVVDDVPPRIRDWHVSGAGPQRRLHVDLQRPVGTGVQVALDLVAHRPLGPLATLPIPAPLEALATRGFLAYRAEDLQVVVKDFLRVSGDDGSFLAFWKNAGQDDPGPEVRAYAFTRQAGPPLLQLQLTRAVVAPDAAEVDHWRVEPQQCTLSATATLTAPGHNLLLVEWAVPPELAGLEVSGADVRSWSRTGSELQVWLQRPCERTEVKLTGWLPVRVGTMVPQGYDVRLPAVAVRVPGRRHVIQVTAADGWSLTLQGTQNLWHLPDSGSSRREYAFIAGAESYHALFRLAPLPPAVVSSLLLVEAGDRKATFTAQLDYSPASDPQPLTVRVDRWEGADLSIDAPGASAQPIAGLGPATRAWKVVLPPTARNPGRIRISGNLGRRDGAELVLPRVRIDGAGQHRQWVAVAGPEVAGDAIRGLVRVSEPGQTLRAWPEEAERIQDSGSAWAVNGEDWELRLQGRGLAEEPGVLPAQGNAVQMLEGAVPRPPAGISATTDKGAGPSESPDGDSQGGPGRTVRPRRPWLQAVLWLCLIAAIAAVTLTPGWLERLSPLQPEAVVVLAAGCYCLRPSPFLILVLLIGVLSRCWLVATWLGAAWRALPGNPSAYNDAH